MTKNYARKVMQNYNKQQKIHQFFSIIQGTSESFVAVCNRVKKEPNHCDFKSKSRDYTSEIVPVSDQIIIEATNEIISKEALENSWDIQTGNRAEMHIKSAMFGMFKLSWGNYISNSSNAQYYFHESVKFVISYSFGIRILRRFC